MKEKILEIIKKYASFKNCDGIAYEVVIDMDFDRLAEDIAAMVEVPGSMDDVLKMYR